MTEKFKLTIDTTNFKQKPNNSQIGGIINRFKNNVGQCAVEVTAEELMNNISAGRTVKCCTLKGGDAKIANWNSQQLYFVDIDSEDKTTIEPESLIRRYRFYGMCPMFYYETFSSKPESKRYRVVFAAEQATDDPRIANLFIQTLALITPEADKNCLDLIRNYFGTNHECVVIDLDKRIRLENIPFVVYSYLKINDRSGHYSRQLERFCSKVFLNVENDRIRLFTPPQNLASGLEETIYNKPFPVNSPDFNITVDKCLELLGQKGSKNKTVKPTKTTVPKDLIEKFDFDKLESSCALYHDFVAGEWLYHNSIFLLANTLGQIMGGTKKGIEIINKYDCYEEDRANKINTFNYCLSSPYERCCCSEERCPHYNECNNPGYTPLDSVNANKQRQITKIQEEEQPTISKEQAVTELNSYVKEALDSKDNDIWIIKAPTGLGKTEALKTLNNYDNFIYAYPNYKCGDDTLNRLNIQNIINCDKLPIEDEAVLSEIARCYAIDDTEGVRQAIYNSGADENDIIRYYNSIDAARETATRAAMTHERTKENHNSNIDTIIYDEDCTLTVMFQSVPVDIDTISQLLAKAPEDKYPRLNGSLKAIKEAVEASREHIGVVYSLDNNLVSHKEIKQYVAQNKTWLNTSIKQILRIKKVITVDNRGALDTLGAYTTALPNKKILILSATVDTEVVKALNPKRTVHTREVKNVEMDGEILQVPMSCTRGYMGGSNKAGERNTERIIKKLQDLNPELKNIITYKCYSSPFIKAGYNVIANFGACQGVDAYKGQDLAVIGTPHVPMGLYVLMASFCMTNLTIEENINYTQIKRNGFQFYFPTFSNAGAENESTSLLRSIQFYFIESELIQAVGRARVLRNKCTVYLFSNLPLPNVSIIK